MSPPGRATTPQAIGDLFSADATYRYHPEDDPVRGRDAIVADWLEDRDQSGEYDARYEPLAIDASNGNHVASGWSRYFTSGGDLKDEYWNIYLVTFDDAGPGDSVHRVVDPGPRVRAHVAHR